MSAWWWCLPAYLIVALVVAVVVGNVLKRIGQRYPEVED